MKETLEYIAEVRKRLFALYDVEQDDDEKLTLKSILWAFDYQTAMIKDKDNLIRRAINVLNQEDYGGEDI